MEITEHDRFYWQYEYDVVAKYLLPLMREWGVKIEGGAVLDVGCGDGGALAALHDAGMIGKGFDREPRRIELALEMCSGRTIEVTVGEIGAEELPFAAETFDLVVLHDVLEHLEEKAEALETLKGYLKPDGKLLITFPPFYSAFGGHQQLLRSKLCRIPFIHLFGLTRNLILPSLRHENKSFVEEVQRLGRMKFGIKSFENLARKTRLRILKKKMYLISPNHIRFGLRPLGAGFLGEIPVLREFVVTGTVYLLVRD